MGALQASADTVAHELALAEEFSRNFNLPFVKPDLGLIYSSQNYPDKECFQPLSHPMSPTPAHRNPTPLKSAGLDFKASVFPQICKVQKCHRNIQY